MLRLITDENFDARILRGLMARLPEVDVGRVQDCGLSGKDDPEVLSWAAGDGRVLLTHDVSTMTDHAIRRVKAGEPLPGIVVVSPKAAISQILDELLLLIQATEPAEIADQLIFLPL